MSDIKIIGRAAKAWRVGSSHGNPVYGVRIRVGDGVQQYLTEERSQIGYAITNPEFAERDHEFTINKRGRIVSAKEVA